MGTVLKSINAVRIFLEDLHRARRLYRDVLELDEKSAGPDWAVFDIDGPQIVIEALRGGRSGTPACGATAGRFIYG
jgi:hypothetical protein